MIELIGESNWRELAACQSADPELFFPVSGKRSAMAEVVRAKAVCASCTVRAQCLDFAVTTQQVHGIWGGTGEEERRVLILRDRRSAARQPG